MAFDCKAGGFGQEPPLEVRSEKLNDSGGGVFANIDSFVVDSPFPAITDAI